MRQGRRTYPHNGEKSKAGIVSSVLTLDSTFGDSEEVLEQLRPGYYWHPKKRRWRPIVVKGDTTGPDVAPACADCPSLPWETCKCWPDGMRTHSERIANALPTHEATDVQPTFSERLNAEADARLQLALEI